MSKPLKLCFLSHKDRKRSALVGVIIASSVALSSCGENPGISSAKKFGAMSSEFKENTNKLADDIYESCIRRIQFYQIDNNALRQARDQAWRGCEEYNKPASRRAKIASQVIVDYIISIGKLSADEVVTFDNELMNVGSALKGLSIPTGTGANITLPTSAVDTGVQIASFVANWAANRYRAGKLSQAIGCTDQPLQSYSKGLSIAFNDGYINGILQQELDQAQFFYNDYAAIASRQGGTWRDYSNLSKESYNAVVPILQRRNAALAYLAIIKRTASAHQELAKIFTSGGSSLPPASQSCQSFFDQSPASANAQIPSRRITHNERLTAQETARIQKVLMAYRNDLAPLLSRMETSLDGK